MRSSPEVRSARFDQEQCVEAHASASIRHGPGRQQETRSLSLALQGGGSFGAFTWGVLDRLLEEENLLFDAVSGASAGAVNAVLLASGLADGGRRGARKRLQRFWQRAGEAAPRIQPGIAAAIATRILSPYQFNPFNLNPLRTLLANEIDFDVLRHNPSLRLLIGATRVRDGKMHVFQEKDLTIDVILASACLPVIHHAVSIDGETYWDGGYSANPPLIPLVARSRASEILIVQIMPTAGADMPTTASEIAKRMEQITFNSSLLRDMDALAAMTKLAEAEVQGSRLLQRLQKLRLHHVSAETEYPLLSQSSALNSDWHFLLQLRDAGRVAADRWLSSSWELSPVDPSRAARPPQTARLSPSMRAQPVTLPLSLSVRELWQKSQKILAKLLNLSWRTTSGGGEAD
ncbi:patatin-like phospholipase family protein [Microvirga sp. VF16]|uniref:patatin-like phospholipase family protein n=1 Tax=Microvirga sp. VF16 TaxID=2807101 RepID=UPI00193E3A5B|nr:patatin-like phospholipase family protein [Microvirga sp. VF16]QRM33523.1 patatin-like phospholipase family protein [Microvirga sp. VF16]